jgi:tetratricopeptide (TPR) repeat protein
MLVRSHAPAAASGTSGARQGPGPRCRAGGRTALGSARKGIQGVPKADRQDPGAQKGCYTAREIVAEIHIAQGRYQKAVDDLLRILLHEEEWYDVTSPTNAAQLLGNLYYAIRQDTPTAAAFFERYLQLRPDETLSQNANLPNVKDLLRTFKGRDQRVMLSYLTDMLAREPRHRMAHLRQAELRFKQGELDLGERELTELRATDPGAHDVSAAMFLSLAQLYEITDDSWRARALYERYRAAL